MSVTLMNQIEARRRHVQPGGASRRARVGAEWAGDGDAVQAAAFWRNGQVALVIAAGCTPTASDGGW
jgi:hypothetical protein